MGCSGLGAAHSLRLSDKLGRNRLPVVRFFVVFGQVQTVSLAGCPILHSYRTSSDILACYSAANNDGRSATVSRLTDPTALPFSSLIKSGTNATP